MAKLSALKEEHWLLNDRLFTCVFKLQLFSPNKSIGESMAYFWSSFIGIGIANTFFHEIYVLVLTILLKSIVNNTDWRWYLFPAEGPEVSRENLEFRA